MRLKDENIFFFAPTLRVKYEFQISKLGSAVVKVKCTMKNIEVFSFYSTHLLSFL